VIRIAIVAAFLLPCAATAAEVPHELSLTWSELPAVVTGHAAKVRLSDGGSVVGKIHGVEPAGLRMAVSFATDEKRFPSRKLLIPAAEITQIRIEKRTRRWRAILTAGVPVVLLVAMAEAVQHTHPTSTGRETAGVAAAVAAGGTIGGYIAGWRLDRRDVLLVTILSPSGGP
jgi:hypothetical protein